MRQIITLFLIAIASVCKAQNNRYIIELTNKQGSIYAVNNAFSYLSAESIQRKKKFNIVIDSTDFPVTPAYLDSIKLSGNVEILNTSKWLNQVLIKTTDQAALVKIRKFAFVKNQYSIAKKLNSGTKDQGVQGLLSKKTNIEALSNLANTLNYGSAGAQIYLHEGEFLHNKGLQGNGIKIAVLDAGFAKYQNIAAFDSLRLNNKILGTWDFVEKSNSVNEDDIHGMWCLSILGANIPGSYVGSAPRASYYLYRTEDVASEFPVEEQNWAAAAERADSLGVDIITSSLGYSEFDDPSFNYTYADMNGKKTIVSRAATFASQKGMIVTNSAGNEGGRKWKFIIAPADVSEVLSVGAINVNKQVASFSSYGPTGDGRVKPDVTSVGWNTFLINLNGTVGQGNGTSFSNPNLAGLIACLWQAFPEFNNKEIINAVKQSADHYDKPDNRTGYGIPNMRLAFSMLEKERKIKEAKLILKANLIKAFPNPFSNKFTIVYKGISNGKIDFNLLGIDGRFIRHYNFDTIENEYHYFILDQLESLPIGQYFLQYFDGINSGTIRVSK
jgi:subtilisin family serine protease